MYVSYNETMPKGKASLIINLDLLRPQSNPEKFLAKAFRWLLSSGRYIFVFVEALVLIAFIARFKLDADLAAKKEAIEDQIKYIETLKSDEILIRQTQLKLSTIGSTKKNTPDWSIVFKKIADQTPVSTQITNINITKTIDKTAIHMLGQTQVNTDLTNFIAGLRSDDTFTSANIIGVEVEQGVIKFTIDASAKLTNSGEKNL